MGFFAVCEDLQRRLVCALRHGTFGFSGHFALCGYLEISELTNVLRCTRGELHQAVQLDSGNSKRRVDDSRQGYLHAFQGHSSDCGHELAYMNPPLTSQEIKEVQRSHGMYIFTQTPGRIQKVDPLRGLL